MERYNEVLFYWFLEPKEEQGYLSERMSLWFGHSPETDKSIADRFGDLVKEAMAGGLQEWEKLPRGRLALLLLLDQFTRNIYRGSPNAFAADARARELCLAGIELGHDKRLTPLERMFFYLPLEHSEQVELQNQSVSCFKSLVEDAPPHMKDNFESYLDYALRHHQIVERFGRFPHRNTILGRESTPEEIKFLKQPGSSF